MTLRTRFTVPSLLLVATLGLAACQSDEEKIAEFYESAMSLLAAGDTERAKVELRNALQIDVFDVKSRMAFAEIMMDEGSEDVAFRNYLYVIEKNPDTPEVRLILAELAFEGGNLEDARRHGEAAIALVPDDLRAKVLKAALDYQAAQEAGDVAARTAAAETAAELLAQMPDSSVARRVVIDNTLRSDNPGAALPEVDTALANEPDSLLYNRVKLQLLIDQNDVAGVGDQLRSMATLFPDDADIQADLIRYYIGQQDLEGAEAYLRELADAETGQIEDNMMVAQFLEQTKGPDAARAEIARLVEANGDTVEGRFYSAMEAAMQFAAGEQDQAIATFESVTARMEEQDDPRTNEVKAILAKLLNDTGNTVGARAQVEEILASDPSNVAALKLRASAAIQEDDSAAALEDLRTAINQSPQDADILSLMADAYMRDGDRQLAGERLSQAVEVTNSRPAEALRYYQFLMADDRTAAAVSVLADARAANPNSVDVLTTLGRQLVDQESWVQAQRVADDLNQIGTVPAQQAARALTASLLAGQGRVDESVAFLENQMTRAGEETDSSSIVQLVQLNVQKGDTETARRILDEAIAKSPDDLGLRMLDATLLNAMGDADGAVAALRSVIEDEPQIDAPVQLLYNVLLEHGDPDAASLVLTEALDRMAESTVLLWMRASELERDGDIDGALAIYEQLYATDSSSTVIANNLASMIATYKDDPESLDRAARIARRLRELDVPAFLDTYGWISYRKGDFQEALTSLGRAAEGLPDDPLVQYHLGMAQLANEDRDAARVTLTRALDLAGDSPLPQFDDARRALADIDNAPSEDTTAPAAQSD